MAPTLNRPNKQPRSPIEKELRLDIKPDIFQRMLYDYRVMPGRSRSNADILQASLEALQQSRKLMHGSNSAKLWPAQAALDKINKARKVAAQRRRRGDEIEQGGGKSRQVTYKDVMNERARVVDALTVQQNRFLRTAQPVSASASASAPASASASASWENEARAARLQQDERRRTTQLSDFLTATAAVIELRSAARTEMRHRMHPGLLPPRVTSTGLFTRQPRTAESETPYADQLLLSERMKDHQPPQQPHAGPPLILMHNPGCGGGFHNPYPIHDEPQPDGSEEHPYTLW